VAGEMVDTIEKLESVSGPPGNEHGI